MWAPGDVIKVDDCFAPFSCGLPLGNTYKVAEVKTIKPGDLLPGNLQPRDEYLQQLLRRPGALGLLDMDGIRKLVQLEGVNGWYDWVWFEWGIL